jgi:hypothetical protein
MRPRAFCYGLLTIVAAIALNSKIAYGQSPETEHPTTRSATLASSRPLASVVGFYHWGGKQPDDFSKGIASLQRLQGRIFRISLSARMELDYGIGSRCLADFSLPGVLERPHVRRAVTDPQLEMLMITAYDGVSFADCATHAYLSPGFYTPEHTEKLVQEYEAFAYRLRELAHSRRVQLIISNWEGDNAIYCGSAYSYTISTEFQESCTDAYPGPYAGNRRPSESIAGMILWHRARYAGISKGNARADKAGLNSKPVLVAPEISAVRMLEAKGLPSVLRDVVPHIPFDYVSYSSYESLSSEDPAAVLSSDLRTIRAVAATDRIIVGEVGFPRASTSNGLVAKTIKVLRAAIESGAAYIIQWNLHDGSSADQFGMIDEADQLTEVGAFYQAALHCGLDIRNLNTTCGAVARAD